MRAFHDDPEIKSMLVNRCITSRGAGRYRQGGCHDEHDMHAGCATACMLQTPRPRLRDFDTQFGLSCVFAKISEMLFEALPYEAAVLFPEYVVMAIPIGADTSLIGWQLLHRTLSEHAGAGHRLVAATVKDTLEFLAPLTVGNEVDIVDAREKMFAAGRVLKTAVEAIAFQKHPLWEAVLIATDALEAAATMDSTEVANKLTRTLRLTTRTPEGALGTARRMIALLAGNPPALAPIETFPRKNPSGTMQGHDPFSLLLLQDGRHPANS